MVATLPGPAAAATQDDAGDAARDARNCAVLDLSLG